MDIIDIEPFGNYYGGLQIKTDGGKFYAGIENYDGTDWDEIPESLFVELKKYQEECDKKAP